MSDATPVGELYVLRLLQSSSCYRGDVCTTPPCACAQSLLDEIGKPLRAEIERLRSRLAALALEAAAEIERLQAALETINRITSPGTRNLDELIRDMGSACNIARATLAGTEGGR